MPMCSDRASALLTLGLLVLINLFNYIDRYSVASVLVYVKDFYQINDQLAGLLQTVFICSFLAFAPIFGFLGDRYTRKFIVGGAMMFSGIVVMASSFVPKNMFWLFILLRALVGVGEAGYVTVAPAVLSDLFEGDARSRSLMVFYLMIPFGSGLGYIINPAVAAAMGDIKHTWQWALRTAPILGFTAGVIFLFTKEAARKSIKTSNKDRSVIKDAIVLAKVKTFTVSTVGYSCVTFMSGATAWWATTFFYNSQKFLGREYTNEQASSLFGLLTMAGGAVGTFMGAIISQIWRRKNLKADTYVCAIGLILSGIFTFLSLRLPTINLSAAFAVIFLAITTLSFCWSVTPDILLYTVPPNLRATASGVQNMASHLLGDAASPYIVGLISDLVRGSQTTDFAQYVGLEAALSCCPYINVLGGFLYLMTSFTVIPDRQRATAEQETEMYEHERQRTFSVLSVMSTEKMEAIREEFYPSDHTRL